MTSFQEWIVRRENKDLFAEDDKEWLLNDLSNKAVGIGCPGLFTIDYGFTGNVGSTSNILHI